MMCKYVAQASHGQSQHCYIISPRFQTAVAGETRRKLVAKEDGEQLAGILKTV
jgi:hypothetical protein